MRVEYISNNSGGDWWLKDEDWKALESAGWKVDWIANQEGMAFCQPDKEGRWLGALAKRAVREGLNLREAAREWELVTGARATDAGCACCGQPHNFTEYDDDDNEVASGPNTEYSARW